MGDVKLADCRVVMAGWAGGEAINSRPMSEADLDALIRERGVTDEMMDRAAKAAFLTRYPDGNWEKAGKNRRRNLYYIVSRAAVLAALSGEEG